jgi:hypothetical protein
MPLTSFGLRSTRNTLVTVSLIGSRDSKENGAGGQQPLPPRGGTSYWPPAAATVSGFGETVVSVVSSSVAT